MSDQYNASILSMLPDGKPPVPGSIEHLVSGLHMIHSVIRRGTESIIRAAPTVTEQNLKEFKEYILSYISNVISHHDHEEEIFFPILKEHFPPSLLTRLQAEHHDLHPSLDALTALVNSWFPSPQNPTPTPYNPQQVIDAVNKIKTLFFPHLEAEEEQCTIEWFRSKGLVKESKDILDKMNAAVRKDSPVFALPFIVFNLRPEERCLILDDMPWPVRKVLVPMVFCKWYSSYWQFAWFNEW